MITTFKALRAIAMAGMVASLGACAFGNTVNYTAQAPIVTSKPTEAVAVGVQDRRPYVLSGENTVQFVGLQRGGFGNPFGVHTSSGRPLSDEFADTIASSLGTPEQKPQVIRLTPQMSREQALAALTAAGANKVLFVTIAEWKSDIYVNLRMQYDLRAVVTDRAGKVLGEHKVSGDQNMGAQNHFTLYASTLPSIQKGKLEELLNDPKIAKALAQTPPPAPRRPQRRP